MRYFLFVCLISTITLLSAQQPVKSNLSKLPLNKDFTVDAIIKRATVTSSPTFYSGSKPKTKINIPSVYPINYKNPYHTIKVINNQRMKTTKLSISSYGNTTTIKTFCY